MHAQVRSSGLCSMAAAAGDTGGLWLSKRPAPGPPHAGALSAGCRLMAGSPDAMQPHAHAAPA